MLYLKAYRQARKQQSGQVQGAIPEQNPKPKKAPKPVKSRSAKARPAGDARKTRSQSKADKEVHPVKALLNMTSCRRIKKPHAHLRNITAFRNNIRACSNNAKEVIAALDDDLRIDRITAEKVTSSGSLLYRVKWHPTLLQKRIVHLFESQGHYGKHSKLPPNLYGPVVRSRYLHMDWHDTWEPEEAMHNQPESPALFEAYMTLAARRRASQEERPDADLQNVRRQGHGHRALYRQELSLTQNPELTANITINTSTSVHPDLDVQGTGAFHIQQHPEQPALVTIHSPTGAFLGEMMADRLAVLHTAHMQDDREPQQDFATAIAALLSRYKDSSPSSDAKRVKMRNHWATPPLLMAALIQALELTTECFASPLNFDPAMRHYFAAHKDDEAFGAHFDAYSMPWLGPSQANPEYESSAMEKAVRWAIMSAASTEEASLTAFILPEWKVHAYYRYMQDPRVHRLLVVPKIKFKFRTPDF